MTRTLLGTLALVTLFGTVSPVAAQSASASADFEAALRATPEPAPSRRAGPTSDRRLPGEGLTQRAAGGGARGGRLIAPAGAIPARFRATTRWTSETETLISQAVRDGELDAVAMMEQIAGPLPIPPGARPVRCMSNPAETTYTLGVEASPEFLDLVAAVRAEKAGPPVPSVRMVNGRMVPSAIARFVMQRAALADSPTTRAAKARAEAFLLSQGMVRSDVDGTGRWGYRPGPRWPGRTPISIVFDDDGVDLSEYCAREGIQVPLGPVMTISYG